MDILLPSEDLPDGFTYPREFQRLIECGLVNLEPWQILTGQDLRQKLAGLTERYPRRSLVPFAQRQDNDDVACWDTLQPGSVLIVHDFASPGWELQGQFPDTRAWLRQAFADFVDWDS